jgi:GNAT superfamily N-acetyltransferase
MITFRLARPDELPELAEMRWQFRAEHDAAHPNFDPSEKAHAEFIAACLEILRAGFSEGHWAYWVAVQEDGLILSNLYVYRIPKLPRPGRLQSQIGYITSVFTRPAWRGQGIGSQLMQHVKAWGTENGVERMILWPAEGRQNFYSRLGFHPSSAMEWEE